MLSRHFYAIDELHAALQYASTRNDRSETLFWCHELIRSGYIAETISTLFESWIWNKGPFSLAWMSAAHTLASDEVSEDDIFLSAYQLSWISYTQRDSSVWNILALTAQNTPPERLTPKTPPYLPSNDQKEIYFIKAVFQGKAYSAWWMSRHLQAERVCELLRWYVIHMCPLHADSYLAYFTQLYSYDTLLGYKSDEYDIVIQCVAVLSACLTPEQQERSWKPLPDQIESHVLERIKEWDGELDRKKHRRYSIPTACLYGKTARGRIKWSESTIAQLGLLEKRCKGCPFWDEIIEEYQTNDEWKSDDDREAFYERYFADDIPDEWTAAEKKYSHGDGILAPTEQLNLGTYARRFFSSVSRFAWGNGASQEFLRTKNSHCPLSIVHDLPPLEEIPVSLFRPLHRRVYLS